MTLLKVVPAPSKPTYDGREHRLSKYFEDHVEEGRRGAAFLVLPDKAPDYAIGASKQTPGQSQGRGLDLGASSLPLRPASEASSAAAALGPLMTRLDRSIPRGLVLMALALLLASAGCADPNRQAAQPNPGLATSSAVAETPLGACTSVARDQGISLSRVWADVVASEGSSDRQRLVQRFADDAEKAAGARYDAACADVGAMMVQLSAEAGRLSAWMLIGDGDAELSKYQAVAEAGNVLMKRLGVDQPFETPGLTGT